MAPTPNSQLRSRADSDVRKRSDTILGKKDESIEPELERIRESLIEHRNNRDTTNIPSVEQASSKDRVEAVRRRMHKARWSGADKRDKSNVKSKNVPIADSGTPNDGSALSGGSGGGDSGGGGGDGGGS